MAYQKAQLLTAVICILAIVVSTERVFAQRSELLSHNGENASETTVRRQFIDGRYGQIHLRVAKPASPSHRPLICLHMSPKSGSVFANFLAAAATDRIVVAPDYPGFGESDPPPSAPAVTIEDYAESVWQVIDRLDLGQVDLLGYHTGSEVAAEAARQRPNQVGAIVMISAPVFTPQELAEIKRTYQLIPLDEAGTRFQKLWASVMHHRGPGMTLEMAATSFAEHLRAGENYEWGHHAAFEYAPRYPGIVANLPHRITVINPGDDLVEMTPRIIPHLANGRVVNRPQWGHGFLDAFTEDAVAEIKAALDN